MPALRSQKERLSTLRKMIAVTDQENIAIGLSDWNISKHAFKSLAIPSKNWIFRGTKMPLWDKQRWS